MTGRSFPAPTSTFSESFSNSERPHLSSPLEGEDVPKGQEGGILREFVDPPPPPPPPPPRSPGVPPPPTRRGGEGGGLFSESSLTPLPSIFAPRGASMDTFPLKGGRKSARHRSFRKWCAEDDSLFFHEAVEPVLQRLELPFERGDFL